jgi:hypothetical protein
MSIGKNLMRTFSTIMVAVMLAAPIAASAASISYNFNWTGTDGYTMSGNFSFDTANAADGAIRDGEVASLFFEGFLNSVLVGTNAVAPLQAGFNFNFDTVAEQFFLGGLSADDNGQRWNFFGAGLGFGAGSAASGLTDGSSTLGLISNPAPLVATRAAHVPEPTTLALAVLSLAALGLSTRRKQP